MLLAEVLLLMHRSNGGYRTAHGRAQSLVNGGVREATIRARYPDAPIAHMLQAEWESTTDVRVEDFWVEHPRRLRLERVEGGVEIPKLRIVEGSEWLSVDPDSGAEGSMNNPRAFLHRGFVPELLDPSELLGGLDLGVMGESQTCGRPTIHLAGTSRQTLRERHRSNPTLVAWYADGYELHIDAVTGVCMKAVSLLDDKAIQVVELSEIAFDEPLSDSLFRLEVPAGVDFRAAGDACARVRSAEDVAQPPVSGAGSVALTR
jgi:hypothetical protein